MFLLAVFGNPRSSTQKRSLSQRLARHLVRLLPKAEFLNEQVFDNLGHARRLLAAWRQDYNHVRPHSAHGGLPPAAAGERLRNPDQLRRPPAPLAAAKLL